MTHRHPQSPSAEGMFDKFGCAGAHEVDRHTQIILASNDHDCQAKLTATDFFDKSAHTDSRNVGGRDDAPARFPAQRRNQLLGAIKRPNLEVFASQGVRDLAAFARRRRYDVGGVAQV